MSDANAKAVVSGFLVAKGFEVEEIAEVNDRKTPDLVAQKDGETYAIEVKQKGEADGVREDYRKTLREGDVVECLDSLVASTKMDSPIAKAAKQLEAFEKGKEIFRVLWYQAEGFIPENQAKSMQATVFGIQNLMQVVDGRPQITDCYYFRDSSFYRLRRILDGIILVNAEEAGARLLLNNHSPRYQTFRKSGLSDVFKGAIEDPVELEKEGTAYLADFDCDRGNPEKVLEGVQSKYNLPDLEMGFDWKCVSATVAVPRGLLNDPPQTD